MQLAIDHWLREAAQPTSPAISHPLAARLSEIASGTCWETAALARGHSRGRGSQQIRVQARFQGPRCKQENGSHQGLSHMTFFVDVLRQVASHHSAIWTTGAPRSDREPAQSLRNLPVDGS